MGISQYAVRKLLSQALINNEKSYKCCLALIMLILICVFETEKQNGPRTVKDIKLISGGRILENNRTMGECRSPLYDIPGGVTTMHVIVQPPAVEKGLI